MGVYPGALMAVCCGTAGGVFSVGETGLHWPGGIETLASRQLRRGKRMDDADGMFRATQENGRPG